MGKYINEEKYKKAQIKLIIIGSIITIVSLSLIVYGFIKQFNSFLDPYASGDYIVFIFLGFTLFMFGLAILLQSLKRFITKHSLNSTIPVIDEVLDEYVDPRIEKSGKTFGNFAKNFKSTLFDEENEETNENANKNSSEHPQKEIIKIRCPFCKALNDEDSDFCCKCGKYLR